MTNQTLLDKENADGLIASLKVTEPPKKSLASWTRTRFPYTYAYDYLQVCASADYWSHSDMARMSHAWEPNEDLHWRMCAELALRYMDYYGLVADDIDT